jgi:hypothetical protein
MGHAVMHRLDKANTSIDNQLIPNAGQVSDGTRALYHRNGHGR